MAWNDTLNKITKSKSDRMIAGICGGFAKATESPAWIWRAAFATSVIFGGAGVIAYIILWILMPAARD